MSPIDAGPAISDSARNCFFAEYLYFRLREDSRATLRVKARDGGLRLGRWSIRAVTVTGVFDLLKKPGYTACRVWLPRHPFRSVVSV